MFINAIFENKKDMFKPTKCKIDKIITLSEEEYLNFKKNMSIKLECIKENKDKMYVDENGVLHTILITSPESKDGIIVDSVGSDWARHTAYAPNIHEYLQLKLKNVADEMVKEGTWETIYGTYCFSFKELEENHEIDVCNYKQEIRYYLYEHEEVSDVELTDEGFDVNFFLKYCPNTEEYEEMQEELNERKINVLIVEPNKNPRRATVKSIEDKILSLVGEDYDQIEIAPNIMLIYNFCGKELGLAENRRFKNDMIAGTFIIVGDKESAYSSLTNDEFQEYEKRFWEPEKHSEEVVKKTNNIKVLGM